MAGPLDFLTSDDAQMGLAMLAAAGPTATPMSFGQRLAGGIQQAQAMQTAREDRKLKQLLTNAQIQQLQAETAQKTGLMGAVGGLFGGTPSAAGGGVAAPPQVGLLAPDGQPAPAPQGATASPIMAGPGGGTAAPAAPGAPGSLKGVPLGKITQLRAMGGPDLTEQWKLENLGTPVPPGYLRMADGTMSYTGDPSKGLDASGRMSQGYLADQTALAAATKGAEATAGAKYTPGEPYIDTDPTSPTYMQKILPSRLQQFGGGTDAKPLAPVAAPAAPARNLLSPGGYAGGSSSAAVDGQRQTLLAELPKAHQEVAKAQQSGDAAAAARAQADIAAIQKELARLPGGARAAPVNLLTPTPARAPANVVELSPQEQATNKANESAAASLAGKTGEVMQASAATAASAVESVGTAQRLVKAIDSNKTILGPLANQRMSAEQWATTLGLPGKDTAEKIANTRVALQELSKLTMAGRGMMKGQGEITRDESALAMRATSGDIESLTPAEVKILAAAAERTARFQYAQHQSKMDELGKNQATASQLGIYKAPALPDPIGGKPAKTVTRQGMYGGRKVIQYSDGSVDYAN